MQKKMVYTWPTAETSERDAIALILLADLLWTKIKSQIIIDHICFILFPLIYWTKQLWHPHKYSYDGLIISLNIML